MKKDIDSLRVLLFALLHLIVCGCKSPTTLSHSMKIPESYIGMGDSLNSASIGWREFLTDSVLVSLIDTALKNNFDARTALQRIEMASANTRIARGAMLPAVNAYVAYNQRRFGLYTMDGAGNITTPIEGEKIVPVNLPDYYIAFQSSWEVDVWRKLKNKRAAAVSRYLASIEGKNFVITNLIAELASGYYQLLSFDTQLEIVSENIRLQEEALELTKVQKETGVTSQLGVEQFEAQLLKSKALEKEVLQNILETENRINFLLGRYPQEVPRNKSQFLSTTGVITNAGIPSDLLRYRPDIRQAELELMAAEADVRSARAAFLPSFNITGAYGFQAYRTALLFKTPESMAYNFLAGLSAPLINRNAIKSEFRLAKASQVEALYNYQKAILNGYIEVYNQLANLRALQDMLRLKNQEVEIQSRSIETSSELFRARRATYLEVILTQSNLLQSKLELIDIKRRHFDSSIKLYKALGGGWMQE